MNSILLRLKLLLSFLIEFIVIHIIFSINNPKDIMIHGTRYYFYFLFWILISYVFDRYYRERQSLDIDKFTYQIIKSIKSIFIYGFTILIFNWILGNYVSRSFLLIFLLNLFIFSTIFQFLFNKIFQKSFEKNKYWIFIDNQNINNLFKEKIFFNKERLKIVNIDDLEISKNLLKETYGIVLNDYNNISNDLLEQLFEFKKKGLKIYQLTNWLKIYLKRYPPFLLKMEYFLELDFLILNNDLFIRIKRLSDIFLGISLLLISLPIIFLFGLLIYLEDKGPIFYSQTRTGYLGDKFIIWKLRSMRVDAEKKGIQWASENDLRITNIGSIIRKMRIDELPQLWSVIKGDMSLIGPRPERPEIDSSLISKIPFYNMRYLMRPGLSGWAQVNYPYGASIQDSANKLSFDLYYIANSSIWIDLIILFRTLRLIFNAKGYKPAAKI
tara:strand:+ start:3967 stop:5286 length:1320 start_codon:yes stop_codon:yes gene_type:complete